MWPWKGGEVSYKCKCAITSSFFTRGNHTPNLVIVAHFLFKISWQRRVHNDIHKSDLCDLDSRWRWLICNPKQLLRERYLHTTFDDPSSFLFQDIVVTSCTWCLMEFIQLTSVTLNVGEGDPYTIPSSFSMWGTYTPHLMILAHFLFKISWERRVYDEIYKVDLCNFERESNVF
jgi:hypothetical protein